MAASAIICCGVALCGQKVFVLEIHRGLAALKGAEELSRALGKNTLSGTVDPLTIELSGQEFRLLGAGLLFKFTPLVHPQFTRCALLLFRL
jgi:hypothetical protein